MSPIRMSKVEAAMRKALDFHKAFNHHDMEAMAALTSHDCIYEPSSPAPDGAVLSGKAAIAAHWRDFFRDHPQAQLEVEEIFGYGERCIMRWRCTWKDSNGETGHVRGIGIFRVNDGGICEILSYMKGQTG